MVGSVGCGCCKGCCPDGNTWTYNYYPFTPYWPLQAGGYDPRYLDFTPEGAVFKSPPAYTTPFGPYNRTLWQEVRSVDNDYRKTPPIKHGFGTADKRKLQHKIILPSLEDFAAWDPFAYAEGLPGYGPVGAELEVSLGIAVRPDRLYPVGLGHSLGLSVVWTKRKGLIGGRMVYDWKMTIKGWTGNYNFLNKQFITFATYGFVRTYQNQTPYRFFWLYGDRFPNSLDLLSWPSDSTGQVWKYDCHHIRMSAATQFEAGLQWVWAYVISKVFDYGPFPYPNDDIFYCYPYYQVSVEWRPEEPVVTGMNAINFANMKVVLKQTDWTFGNVIT